MAAGEESGPEPQPSLFGDGPPGGEGSTVENLIPPPRPSQPAGRGTDPALDTPTSRSGGPTILASSASEWEPGSESLESVRSSRAGLIALFLLALVTVVIIALVLAAWSVLRGGGDETDAGSEAGSSTSLPAEEILPSEVDGPGAEDTTVPGAAVGDPNQLRVTVAEEAFVCDGETREFALIGGAEPNEQVAFTSPQAEAIRSGTADASGELPIRWVCGPDQAGTTWELTATGETSGRSVTFLFAGVAAPAAPPPDPLVVTVTEDPFACDGGTRVFASLSGAAPNEQIDFSSPQAEAIRSGTADANGALSIRWQCDPDQAGTVWDLTASGAESGRSVTFRFTGG